ncbi:ADP compounds hydrolase NudE [Coralloluteibacterium thermophilus]|uniref:ADP compounds hydrolase NudE n=1 Tax=Coralloluteibacterium thermophilum TaxID=2707049 RepID=A0ABV9NSV9_9GAMM
MNRAPVPPRVHGVAAREEADRIVETVDLEFSNGEHRRYTRVRAHGRGAVIVAAMPDPDTVLLVREYACGTDRYEIGLPKGRIDGDETIEHAAERELKEEAGFGARRLTVLRSLTLSPNYMTHQAWLVLAEDLYPERLPGDEPEELEVIPWKLDALHELMLREDCSEGRSLAGLFLVREYVRRRSAT